MNAALWHLRIEDLLDQHRPLLRRSWWLVLAFVVGLFATTWGQPSLAASAMILAVVMAGLTPAWMWLRGIVSGVPIVPAIGAGELLVFALPLWMNSEEVTFYTPAAIVGACMAELSFLGLMTVIWYILQRRPDTSPQILAIPRVESIDSRLLVASFLACIGLAALFAVSVSAGWAWTYFFNYLPEGAFPLVRTVCTIAGILGIFFLAMAHGSGILRGGGLIVYLALLLVYLAGQGTSLLLSALATQLMAWTAGYTIGRGRIPWIALLVAVLMLNVLNLGKWEMRRAYWVQFGGTGEVINPAQYPAYYLRWMEAGWREFNRAEDDFAVDQPASILDRASLVQMYLMAQELAPAQVPHLYGETYLLIPQLLVPRILWPDKPRTHLGQIVLNVHFGRQTLEDTQRTYIAWGLLAESWSNFGSLGPPLLGIILGLLFGWLGRLTRDVPMGSLRFLTACVVLFYTPSATQMVMSVWMTALFQSLVVVYIASFLFMRRVPRWNSA